MRKKKVKSIREVPLRFDNIIDCGAYYMLEFEGRTVGTANKSMLSFKTKSKLDSFTKRRVKDGDSRR